MGEHQQVWNLCLATIQAEVNPQSYSTWFKPIRPVRLKESVLTIQVPNKFFYEWLEQHYVDLLKKVIRKELGDKAKLEYQILMQTADEPQQKQKNGQQQESKQNEPNEIRNPFVIPGIRKMKVETQLNKHYTFDNY